MAAYSEAELRYARPIAGAIMESSIFRQWLLAGTKHEDHALGARPIGETQRSLRSPKMKNPYWFNYWCGKDRTCSCRIGTGIETDILLVMDIPNDRRLALHIEVKRPGEHLGDGQAESYPRRAACWANPTIKPRTVPSHHEFLTVLICGRELANDDKLKWFDKVVFHDEIAMQIQIYPELQ